MTTKEPSFNLTSASDLVRFLSIPETGKHRAPYRTPESAARLLETIVETGSRLAGCRAVGINYLQLKLWQADEPNLSRLISAALEINKEMRAEQLDQTLVERALHGTKQDIVWDGAVTGQSIYRDPRLLIAAARAYDPKYQPTKESGSVVNVNIGMADRMRQRLEVLDAELVKEQGTPGLDGVGPQDGGAAGG